MAVFKCKMCGGSLNVENESVAVCEYCGTKQTLPRLTDERRAGMFDRANHFRRNGEYDKAMGVYEQILFEDNTDAESYWSLVLCRFGIEYVKDPATGKRIPTINRVQYTSVYDDDNYKQAINFADIHQKVIYEEEAAVINNIQKGILDISKREQPFDVFICYKESDSMGRRTLDSVLATDIYEKLTKEGLKVFFARITLEDKLGSAYEPYIFAALNSSKVMIALGTSAENFNAVWVRNEWSRYLALIKNGEDKTLIPAYRDMSPYDLPDEFSHLQAQDMGRIGFMQDLVRGVKKIVTPEEPQTVINEVIKEVGSFNQSADTSSLLERAFMFLEDGKWNDADAYCEKVLDIDPKNAKAYLGKLMAEKEVRTREKLRSCEMPFEDNSNYIKVIRFGDEEIKAELNGYISFIKERNETARKEKIYCEAVAKMNAKYPNAGLYAEAEELFLSISQYKNSKELAEKCQELAEKRKKLEEDRIKAERKKFAMLAAIVSGVIVLLLCVVFVWFLFIQPKINKNKAMELLEEGNYSEAYSMLEELSETEIIYESKYQRATELLEEGNYSEAYSILEELSETEIIYESKYQRATELFNSGDYESAAMLFGGAGDYKDARERCFALWDEIAVRETVSAGYYHTVGIKSDGTVVATGWNGNGQYDVSNWTDIVAISVGDYYTVGLKGDGTVVATGVNIWGECDVRNWTDIVAISAGWNHTVGIKSDGTVVATGDNDSGQCDVSNWTDIVAISAGGSRTVGIKSDGTVVATGGNIEGQCDVRNWTDIVAISAGSSHTVGIKSDGTVVATGANGSGQCDVSNWTDIVAISAGGSRTVGIKSDGTVVATGNNNYGQCDVSNWTDIVAISAGDFHTVGIRSDGTVVATGYNDDGQCDVSNWTDIKLP